MSAESSIRSRRGGLRVSHFSRLLREVGIFQSAPESSLSRALTICYACRPAAVPSPSHFLDSPSNCASTFSISFIRSVMP